MNRLQQHTVVCKISVYKISKHSRFSLGLQVRAALRLFVTHSIDAAELQRDERDDDSEELPADVVVEEEVHEPVDLHAL